MLTAEHIIKNAQEDTVLDMISDFGIYAIKIEGIEKTIIAADCKFFYYHHRIGAWYMPHSIGKFNVVPIVERPIFVPYHAIEAIAFNEKPKEITYEAINVGTFEPPVT